MVVVAPSSWGGGESYILNYWEFYLGKKEKELRIQVIVGGQPQI